MANFVVLTAFVARRIDPARRVGTEGAMKVKNATHGLKHVLESYLRAATTSLLPFHPVFLVRCNDFLEHMFMADRHQRTQRHIRHTREGAVAHF